MILKWLGAALLIGVTAGLLSEAGFRGKRAFVALCGAILFSVMAPEIGKMASQVLGFADGLGIGEAAKCAAKIVGAGYLFGIGADILSELGEGGISKALLSAGKIEILAIIFPYFLDILELGISLLK